MPTVKVRYLLPILGAVALALATPASAWDTELMLKLDAMEKNDQAIRSDVESLMKAVREEPDTARRSLLDARLQAQIEKMRHIDNENQQAVADILKSGWPTKESVGQSGLSTIFLITQHASLEFQQSQIANMRQAALRGDIRKSSLALLEDRIRVRQGRPQLYGSQISGRDVLTLDPVEDEANLDKRRKEMGLDPICLYLKDFAEMHGPVQYAPCANQF